MNTATKAAARDRKVILSMLWIFAILNYAYADIMTLFFNPVLQPEEHQRILSGYVGDIRITQGFVLAAAILMETAIVMVLLSRVLPYGANRWANILTGLLHTASVIWSMTGGAVNAFYVFFATIEIACTLFIVWYAWTWRKPALSATPATELRQPTQARP
jgi:MFS family permease